MYPNTGSLIPSQIADIQSYLNSLCHQPQLLSASDPPGKTFSESLYASVEKKFGDAALDMNFACMACVDVGQRGPSQYCMHRDKHRPASPTFLGCQVCKCHVYFFGRAFSFETKILLMIWVNARFLNLHNEHNFLPTVLCQGLQDASQLLPPQVHERVED